MKRELSKRELVLFGVPVLGLLIGMLGYFALVAPQKAKASKLANEIVGAQAALIAAHQKPPKPVSAHAVDLFRLTKAMPDSNDMPGLLRNLSQLSHASNVTLQSFTPSAQIPLAQGYTALPIAIVVDGSFPHVSDFLQRLRSQVTVNKDKVNASGRLLIANSVQLGTADGKSVTATVSLDAFVYGGTPPTSAATTTTATG